MITNLFDRIKLLFRKDRELYSSLYTILGFYPRDLEVYRLALAHKSADYRGRNGKPLNNERLEFLGDAILEATVSDIVYHHFDRKREGFLTSTRSKLVQRKTLNSLAAEIGLDKLLQVSAKSSAHNSYIGGNAFEALVGAIYLDRGYDCCKWFMERRILGRLIDIDSVAQKEVNFKSKLLEWSQKNRILTDFTLDDTVNPGSNSPLFTSKVVLEGILAGEGSGYSKKESQQTAAKEALTRLRMDGKFLKRIYSAKEKRTAMEADEFSVVPRIEEIEEEIARRTKGTQELRTERPVKSRSRRAARAAASQEADGQQREAAEEKRTPKREPRTPEKDVPTKGKDTPVKGKDAPVKGKDAPAKKKDAPAKETEAPTIGKEPQTPKEEPRAPKNETRKPKHASPEAAGTPGAADSDHPEAGAEATKASSRRRRGGRRGRKAGEGSAEAAQAAPDVAAAAPSAMPATPASARTYAPAGGEELQRPRPSLHEEDRQAIAAREEIIRAAEAAAFGEE